jgi:hypothetical protein
MQHISSGSPYPSLESRHAGMPECGHAGQRQNRKSMRSKTMSKNKPVHEQKLGRIKVAIWGNTSPNGAFSYSLTFSRLYKDGEKWKSSTSFYLDDIGPIVELAHTARDWMVTQGPEMNMPLDVDEAIGE